MSASYYGQPVIKPIAWTNAIPTYFFCGGVAGGAMLLAFAERARKHDTSARRLTFGALAALAVSAFCLIDDLGRPRRFHHMLRVFKPTSPMSVGTFVLTAFGAATGGVAASDVLGLPAPLLGAAGAAAALLAPAVCTYTAVLIADTAVPAWHEGRRTMPFVFAATAASSAGALSLVLGPHEQTKAGRRLAVGGALAELAALRRLHAEVGPIVAEAYKAGKAGAFARSALALNACGIVTAIAGRRVRALDVLAGATLLLAGFCERMAVFEAGRNAAADPHYTVET